MEKIFKAKRLDNGEWFEFELKDLLGNHNECLSFIMDKNTICQYTGIKDSKRNRIFEGDESTDEKGKKCIVFFNDRTQQTCIKYYDGSEFAARSYVLEGLTLTGHNIHDKD
jgi:hypothetical protein